MKRAAAIAVVLLSSAVAGPTRADPPAVDLRAEARAIAERGDTQFNAGRCDKAIPLWREAAARFRAPTIMLRIARCQALVGKVVAAAATLESITKEPLEPDAPTAFEEAKQEAERDLKNVRSRVATLTITVDKAADISALPTLEIDDTRVPAVKVERYVDPGHHLIRVHAADVLWERALVIADGEKRDLRISLTTEPPLPPSSRMQRNIGFIVGGTGAVALAVGIAFTASASGISKHLTEVCGPGQRACPASEQGTIDRLKVYSRTADFTVGGGVALLATGALLLLTEPRPKVAPRIRVSASVWSPGRGLGLSITGTY